jgi:inosine-uridine nucleoside N-ribohydrolase
VAATGLCQLSHHCVKARSCSQRLTWLQVTHTVLATPNVTASIAALKSRFSDKVLELLQFFATTYREVFLFEHPPVHDPVAVVYVLRPEIFKGRLMRVDIEVSSQICSGQTVCDIWGQSGKRKNVMVLESVDVGSCWHEILEGIARCNFLSGLNKQA